MLKSIQVHGVGPVSELFGSFGDRLNVLTGDNGLGKSFLLDVCFWSLTGTWPGSRSAIPDKNHKKPTINYVVQSKSKSATREAKYDFKTQSWSPQRGRAPRPGLVIYAGVDGSFSVWDPTRNDMREGPRAFQFRPESPYEYGPITSTIRRDVANGLEEEGRVLCNGLIADWNEWYYQRLGSTSNAPFDYLQAAVATLSHPLEPLLCEEPEKVFVNDSRRFPMLRMPYGVVPFPQWSAGVKRVVNFAYLIVWAWVEHYQAAKLRREVPTNQIILIVDEIEAHLHPRWQRTILPAIMEVVSKLQPSVGVQIFAATHSPLVLASLEPHFDLERDQLFCFHFDTKKVAGKMISFDPLSWAIHGDVVGWLTSDVFGLQQARSREAECAIEAAEAFLRGEARPAPLDSKISITTELKRVLSGFDPFWPRWIVETRK